MGSVLHIWATVFLSSLTVILHLRRIGIADGSGLGAALQGAASQRMLFSFRGFMEWNI